MLEDINQTGYEVLYAKELYTEKRHIGRRSYAEKSYTQKEVIYGIELLRETLYTEKIYKWKKPYTERNCTQKLSGNSYIQKGARRKANFYIERSYARKRVTHGGELCITFGWSQGIIFDMRLQFSSGCISSEISEAKEAAGNLREALGPFGEAEV